MKRLLLFLTLFFLLLVATGCGDSETSNNAGNANDNQTNENSDNSTSSLEGVPEKLQGDIKIGVIRNLPSDDHTTQFLDGARSEGESFGFTVDTYISDGDDARFQDLVAQAIQRNYDGLIISHGKDSYSYDMIKPALEQGIEVVTFDTIAVKDGESLEGITSTQQDDFMLAEMSLDEIVAFHEGDGPAKVLKITIGGIPPLDNREVIYRQYEEEGLIETVDVLGPQNMDNVQSDVSAAVDAALSRYGEGEIDFIWAAWDELAKGAYISLKNNNRTDIKLVSIDISNQDINFMTEEGSVWISTAAVDPHLIGKMNMRLLAKRLAGEEVPDFYELEPHVIRQEDLTPETNMNNLSDVIDGWGESDDFNEDWMDTLRNR